MLRIISFFLVVLTVISTAACSQKSTATETKNSDGSYTLNLKNFAVTYSSKSNSPYIPGTANAFAKRAADICGSFNVHNDLKEDKYEILFGNCKREAYTAYNGDFRFRDYYLYYKDGKLSVDAFSIYGYEDAINYFCEALKGNKTITVKKNGSYFKHKYDDTQLGKILDNYENGYEKGAKLVRYAHRGNFLSKERYPENSISGFKSCIDGNVELIETDAQKTADGVWVLQHDWTTKRMLSPLNEVVTKSTYKQLCKYNLHASDGDNLTVTKEKIATLKDAAKVGKDKIIFGIDKSDFGDYNDFYKIFEENGSIDGVLFRGAGLTPDELSNWFNQLLKAGKKLPLYECGELNNFQLLRSKIQSFKGLSSMAQTEPKVINAENFEEIKKCAKEAKIRISILLICMTELDDCPRAWKKYTDAGINCIMTNFPLSTRK